MTTERNDGGPAFPVETSSTGDAESGDYGHQTGNTTWQFPGMTLRDYFAAKALSGLMGRDWSHHKGSDEALIECGRARLTSWPTPC